MPSGKGTYGNKRGRPAKKAGPRFQNMKKKKGKKK